MRGEGAAADRTVFGIGLSFLAFAVLSTADALTKVLSARYSVFQIASVDGVAALFVVVPLLVRQEGMASLRPRRPAIVILRCALGAGSLMLAFMSFSRIPLADAYALAFLTPLAVTALSAPVLGEPVSWRQWIAVIIGFVAVIGILRPDFGAVSVGQFYMLASAALFALSMLILRRIAKSESSGALLLVYFVMLFLIGLPMAIAQWKTPALADLALMGLTGLCSGLGNLLLVMAFRNASAAIASSFMYTQLIWGTLFGLALFGDLPDFITIGGAAIIMLCGIYTLRHASKAARIA
ncbi:MAG TPA: DMT family transporter [Dongiaceae bacterium]|jgi:drug/metabolite transporter (DMT)-like permease